MTSGRLRRKDNTIFFEPVQTIQNEQGIDEPLVVDPAIAEVLPKSPTKIQ
jgi:hypothetical protein